MAVVRLGFDTHVVPSLLGDAADAMDAALGGQFGGQEAEGDVEAL